MGEIDNTKWIDISGKNDPPKEKESSDYPKAEVPPFVLKKLDFYQLALNYVKCLAVMLSIFLVGRLKCSIFWVIAGAGLVAWLWNKRKIKRENKAVLSRINDTITEKKEVLAKLHDLPSWVYFPDVERAEWLNKIIKQMWPFINNYLKVMIKNDIEPKVKERLPAIIKNFYFETIDVGDIPCRIGGIKVYQEKLNRDEIIIDMEIFYSGDCEFTLNVNNVKSGVKNVNFHGDIRAHINPLISTIPFVGALKVFMLNRPAIDFDFTNIANALDIPGLAELIRKIMLDVVSSMLVLPNKFGLILSKDVESQQIKYLIPKGAIRITIYSAHNLVNADISLLGKGKSDPYTKIYIGAKEFQTSIINDNLDPVWNEAFEAIIDEPFGQRVEISIFDHDPNKDDFLGRIEIDIEAAMKQGIIDTTFKLEDTKHGDIHMRLDWLRPIVPLSMLGTQKDEDSENEDPSHNIRKIKTENLALLKRELQYIDQEFTRKNIRGFLSTAILVVYVDSAKALPFPRDVATEPSPYALLTLAGSDGSAGNSPSSNDIKSKEPAHKSKNLVEAALGRESYDSSGKGGYKTEAQPKTTNPVWEQCFTLLINNPLLATLNLEVKDEKSGKILGSMNYSIGKILEEPNFDKAGNFPLSSKGYNDARVSLIMSLRFLKSGPDPASNKSEDVNVASDTYKKRDTVSYDDYKRYTASDDPNAKSVNQLGDHDYYDDKSNIPNQQYRDVRRVDQRNDQERSDLIDSKESGIPTGNRVMTRKSLSLIHNNTYSNNQEFLKQRKNTVSPRVLLTFYHDDARNKLIVLLERVENLTPITKNPDPYVKFELLPADGKEVNKRKSIVIKNSTNPTFNEKFEWTCTFEELPYKRLLVAVKSEGGFLSSGPTLGSVEINLGQIEFNEERGVWFNLMPSKKIPCFNWFKHVVHTKHRHSE
ncbi:extended synaptotagmin-2-like isoform X2 [Gordionus sp. m RMFG-2023]|uniref:extended synaptotagmin-2-like isoform X2 n=1 Tax=Gordionus sp. m RMFG-2023 TaxID=3053472 RepID=UPI0031FE0556